MGDESLKEKLQTIADKRGYLLAHHGLLAVSGEELLHAYDALYSAINLTERTLSRHDHESVWLAILVTSREPIATHHLRRYTDAGGDNRELAGILSLATFAANAAAYEFVVDHWSPHLPEFDVRAEYLQGFRNAASGIDPTLAQLAAIAIHTCTGNMRALRWHLAAANEIGVDDYAIAESLSLAMFPGSVPNFALAAETWRQMIADGEVQVSAAFNEWAALRRQGGFNEASAVNNSSDDDPVAEGK